MEHISWSCLNSFDKNIEEFYQKYVLKEEVDFPPRIQKALDFGKAYEEEIGKTEFRDYKQQIEVREIIWGYKILWYLDFGTEKEVVECKTKSWRRTEKDIKRSRQFRIYNRYCKKKWLVFKLHQYNKKLDKSKTEAIWFEDPNFEQEILKKIRQVEFFLNQYWVKIKCNSK